MRLPGQPLVRGPAVLIGDAAGLVDPLTGEGIYAAIVSGQLAARHLVAYLEGEEPDLHGYQVDLERQLGKDQAVSERFSLALSLFPELAAAFLRRAPGSWRLFAGLLRGDVGYARLIRILGPVGWGINLVSGLAAVFPALLQQAGFPEPVT